MMKINKIKNLMFFFDFNFLRIFRIIMESEDLDVVLCSFVYLFFFRD